MITDLYRTLSTDLYSTDEYQYSLAVSGDEAQHPGKVQQQLLQKVQQVGRCRWSWKGVLHHVQNAESIVLL